MSVALLFDIISRPCSKSLVPPLDVIGRLCSVSVVLLCVIGRVCSVSPALLLDVIDK